MPATMPRSDDSAATLRLLLDTVSELSMVRHIDDIQRIVGSSARALLHADGATFVLRDAENRGYMVEDAVAPLWKGQRFPLESYISGWAMESGEAVVIEDVHGDPRVPQDAYRPTFVKSLVVVPVRRAEPVAAIGVYWAELHEPTADEVILAQALADSVAVALEHVRVLEELAVTVELSSTDALTGVANRRAWDRALTQALESGSPVTVGMIDLDNFKLYNDINGHQAGDAVLQECGRAWNAALRDVDLVARYGGEEFGLLLPNVDGRLAMPIVARLRAATPPSITVSVGLATRKVGEPIIDVVGRADAALYNAKRAGRNRVFLSADQ
jgi:diguanylate cyclase (GGDEF)-like protein